MFRIDKNYVNLAGLEQGQNGGMQMLSGPELKASAEQEAQEILENAQAEAEQIIAEARNEAALLIRAAQDELEEHRSYAWQTGYNEGAEEGRTALEAKIREDDELLKKTLRELHEERASTFDGLEEKLIALVLEITGKIITIAGETDDNVFKSLIENALKQMNLEGKVTIRVGAKEYERFFSSGSAVFDLGGGVTVTAAVTRDRTLSDGDCVIDTDDETVNAGLDAQLKCIQLAFDKAVE